MSEQFGDAPENVDVPLTPEELTDQVHFLERELKRVKDDMEALRQGFALQIPKIVREAVHTLIEARNQRISLSTDSETTRAIERGVAEKIYKAMQPPEEPKPPYAYKELKN